MSDKLKKIIKSLNLKKATGLDKIPVKIIKLAASVIDPHLPNIIRPIYQKDHRNEIKVYRHISILNYFSKIYEKVLSEQLLPFVNRSLSELISAYRSGYNTNHVLICLIENWRHALDKNLFTSAVLIDLSKAFAFIPHDLLAAKLHAYGLDFDTITFLHNYLKNRKQSVKINNISSFFRAILLGVPQGSILGSFLFNVFINDLLLWLTKSDLHNFADDNIISVTCKDRKDLLRTLEKESESAIDLLRTKNIMAL